MKQSILLIIIISLILISVQNVYGACVIPNMTMTNNITTGTTTICTNNYTVAISPLFRTIGSNVVLDFNGSTIKGNNSARFIYDSLFNYNSNWTIRNGNISNFSDRYIELYSDNHKFINMLFENSASGKQIIANLGFGNSWNITNVTFYSSTLGNAPIYLSGNNHFIDNNKVLRVISVSSDTPLAEILGNNTLFRFNNVTGLMLYRTNSGTTNNTAYNNYLYSPINLSNYGGCSILKGNNISFYNNECYNGYIALAIESTNSTIYNNKIINVTEIFGINIKSTGKNNYIYNNTVNSADEGIYDLGTNNRIYNNSLLNINTEKDNWGLGIYVESANNETYTFNLISNNSGCGIYIHNVTNSYFNNNSIDLMGMELKSTLNKNDNGEPMGAFCVNEIYRGYNTLTFNNLSTVYTQITTGKSTNITILDNNITNTSQFFIRAEGTINLVHNLNANHYWYRAFQFPYYQDKVEIWTSNNYTQLKAIADVYGITSNLYLAFPYYRYCGGSSLNPCNATNNITNTKWIYTISKTMMNFTRQNDNNNPINNVTIYSASAFTPYNDAYNGTVLSNNFDNFTIGLSNNKYLTVGDYQSDSSCTIRSPTFYSNDMANLSLDLVPPVNNNVANLDFLETTCGVTPPVSTCTVPIENINPTTSLTLASGTAFCPGTYYLNDSDDNGALRFNNSNKLYECNNTIIIGNAQSGGKGVNIDTNSNQTVSGCTFINFDKGIGLYYYNVNAINNTLINATTAGIEFAAVVDTSTIENNTLVNSSIYIQNNNHVKINGNNFSGCGIQICGSTPYYNIELVGTYNISITNNTLTTGEIGIMDFATKGLLTISNNYISKHDRGISLTDRTTSNVTTIFNNTFINNTNNYDAYQLDIEVLNATNIDINNNTFSESVDTSINMQMVSNILIRNNTFNLVCLTNRSLYLGNGQNEPCTAIKIGQLFKTWNYRTCLTSPYVMGCAKNTYNSNISIFDNNYNNETVVYLFLEGVNGLSHNMNNFYNRTFAFTNLTNTSILYVNSNKTSIYNNIRNYNPNSTYANNLYAGTENTIFAYYGFNTTQQFYRNDNTTKKYNITISNALVYSPYNDAYNESTSSVLSNNFDTFTLAMNPSSAILIGNYQADTCDGSINCVWVCGTNLTSNLNMKHYNITFNGTGNTYLVSANLTNFTVAYRGSCNLFVNRNLITGWN